MNKNIDKKISQTESLIGELEKRIKLDLPSEAYKINARRISNLYKYKENLKKDKTKNYHEEINHSTIFYADEDDCVETRVNGEEVEYHTSYGWFTDEQMENLQGCRYFND